MKQELFNKVKYNVTKYFSHRPGFTEEVVDAIAATYTYLHINYPEVISPNQIPDSNTFKIKGASLSGGYKLSHIYINRLFNNVQQIEWQPKGGNEYITDKKMLTLCESSLNGRIKYWSVFNFTPEQQKSFSKKLRTKIIVHELIHAGSDNGLSTGFGVYYTDVFKWKKFSRYVADVYTNSGTVYQPGATRLEEMITEWLALEIVGCNTTANFTFNDGFKYCSRNIDSSNNALNALTEYVVRALPEIVKGKFTNGIEYLENLCDDPKFNCTTKQLNDSFRRIAQIHNNDGRNQAESEYQTLQLKMLEIYNEIHCFNTKEETQQAIKDWTAFNAFACQQNGQIHPDLKKELDALLFRCKQASAKFGINILEVHKEERARISGKEEATRGVFNAPYAFLKEDDIEKII